MRSIFMMFAGLALACTLSAGEPNMITKVVDRPAFSIIGLECRTNNAQEISGGGCIGQQWAKLMRGKLLDKIPNRADKKTIAVYTDYASDKDGDYTYILGAKVNSTDVVPQGMVAKTIPAGKYAVFTSDKGPVQDVVVKTWKLVWAMPKSQPGGDRAYQSDFEIYDHRAADPQRSQVDV